MYSVLRFCDIQQEEMEKIAFFVNRRFVDFCDHVTPQIHDPHCFSYPISKNEEWWDHHEEIYKTFLN